jgi:hypothetical protein
MAPLGALGYIPPTGISNRPKPHQLSKKLRSRWNNGFHGGQQAWTSQVRGAADSGFQQSPFTKE